MESTIPPILEAHKKALDGIHPNNIQEIMARIQIHQPVPVLLELALRLTAHILDLKDCDKEMTQVKML